MPQKMRMLFALFITLPLIFGRELEPGFGKSAIFGDVDKEIVQKVYDFSSKSEEEKLKALEELDGSISNLNEEIKKYTAEKKETPNEKLVELLKKIDLLNNYLRIMTCKKEDKNYQNCENEKKTSINNLLNVVEVNFAQCPTTVQYLSKLTDKAFTNLKLISNVAELIIKNLNLIGDEKIDIIANFIDCLGSKVDDYWPLITAQLEKSGELDMEPNIKMSYGTFLIGAAFKLMAKKEKIFKGGKPKERRYTVYEEELIDILKEIKDSNKGQTLTVVLTCLATITILVGGFLLYRYLRRKNSNLIENPKDLVTSENN